MQLFVPIIFYCRKIDPDQSFYDVIKNPDTDRVYSEIKTPPTTATPTATTTPTATAATTTKKPAAAAGLQKEFAMHTCAAYEPNSVDTEEAQPPALYETVDSTAL